jgi:transposase
MPKAFPLESRRDVVAVARKGEVPLSQVARDLGISEACLHRWLRLADREDRVGSGVAGQESVELREARKRVRQLEQENEILRRAAAYFARDLNPKWPTTRPAGSGGGDDRLCGLPRSECTTRPAAGLRTPTVAHSNGSPRKCDQSRSPVQGGSETVTSSGACCTS